MDGSADLNRYEPATLHQTVRDGQPLRVDSSPEPSDLIADAAEPGYNEAALVLRRLR